MDDNNDEDEETVKRKKIRKILLLKTDDELKMISKKKPKIMINSKTTEEINKSYNLYNILLSEKSKIYFNFVKTGEKIVSNNIKPISPVKVKKEIKKIEKQNKILNSSIEEDSNSPILNYFPKKINFGLKIIGTHKGSSKNERTIENYRDFEKTSKDEKIIKSTRIEKKALFRLVDKIVNKKRNEDGIDIIKKSILKLRKICNKLRKPKKKVKKNRQKALIAPKTPQNRDIQMFRFRNENRDNKDRRIYYKKRMTITDNKLFLKKRKSLFESQEKRIEMRNENKNENKNESKNEIKIKRIQNHLSTTKYLDCKMLEMQKDKNLERMGSTRIIKIKRINSITNKDKRLEPALNPKKRKIKKMQTLTGNVKNQFLELSKIKNSNSKVIKNSEITKNDESLINKNPQNHLLSSKIQRPPKFQFNNNNNNTKNAANKELTKSKFNPKVDNNNNNNKNSNKILLTTRDKKENEKDKTNIQYYLSFVHCKERNRFSTKKSKKYSVKMLDNFQNKKEEKSKVRKSFCGDEEDIQIFSEFNKKIKERENNI